MRYLVFGTILSDRAFTYNLAANPASTKWLRGFVNGLESVGAESTLCGHCYSRVWPKGKLRPGSIALLDDRFDNHLVQFWNLPGLRFASMGRAYFRTGDAILNTERFDAILTYNPYPWHTYAARRLRRDYKIPWVCLNLDFDDVGGDWSNFLRDAGDADGQLFLSHWGYENAPVSRKIHLDAGISALPDHFGRLRKNKTLNIVYLGKLSKAGGLEALLALPKLISDENVRFIYGGKGYPEEISKLTALAESDSRVDFRGFVEDHDVDELFQLADVFLNPRDPEDLVNDMVFPSKIMHYLQTGKTVVSTWTKGLEPVYRDVMLFADSPSIEDFAKVTTEAIRETEEQRCSRTERIAQFLKGSRLWRNQAERFNGFVSGVCKDFEMNTFK